MAQGLETTYMGVSLSTAPPVMSESDVDELLSHDPLLEQFDELEREVAERERRLRQAACSHGLSPDAGFVGLVSCSACGLGAP